jgi:alkylhydroperoxidase family enzyme
MLPTIRPLLEELHPDGARAMARLDAAAWDNTDPELLALCAGRVAQMLGGEPERNGAPVELDERKLASLADWDTSLLFTESERAHLAFTEQFVVSVRDITDADVNALLVHASPEQVRSFVAALYAVEMGQRVDLVGSIVLTNKE